MIYLKPMGGLGNILFQVAAVKAMALDANEEMAIVRNNRVPPPGAPFQPLATYENNILSEYNFISHAPAGCKVYSEYFQNEKYFDHHRRAIIDSFKLPEIVLPFEKYVSVHIRRTDYVRPGNQDESLSVDYYKRAMGKLPGATFVFVSDDRDYIKHHFPDQYIYVGASELEDLALMANAKYHIIANSSFSWWGAYLADSYLTVAPNPWMQCNTQLASEIVTSRTVTIPR